MNFLNALFDFLMSTDLQRLIVAIVLGMAVGLERELSEKPAGLKTNVLICLGSCLFTMCSLKFPYSPSFIDAHIAAQIVAGVGFLGAGAIMREGEHVTGLTTAATIWLVAAIGLASGMGQYTLAGASTLGALLVQIGMTRLDIVVDTLQQRQRFRIVTAADDGAVNAVARAFQSNKIRVMRRKVMKREKHYHSEWWTSGTPAGQDKVVQELLASDRVIEVNY
ncbi:MAG: MgtC/SapB family protein [Proteobacteria bacterium]|nr:MgtC/SapB family protein [Pseudomonadota bacterium]